MNLIYRAGKPNSSCVSKSHPKYLPSAKSHKRKRNFNIYYRIFGLKKVSRFKNIARLTSIIEKMS